MSDQINHHRRRFLGMAYVKRVTLIGANKSSRNLLIDIIGASNAHYLYFTQAKLALTADGWWNGNHPFTNNVAGGSIDPMTRIANTKIIHGHGRRRSSRLVEAS